VWLWASDSAFLRFTFLSSSMRMVTPQGSVARGSELGTMRLVAGQVAVVFKLSCSLPAEATLLDGIFGPPPRFEGRQGM
jgi:hypothetical protein